jgi:hypothetical protein
MSNPNRWPTVRAKESLPTTGGLYDLDTLDEDLVHPTGPSSSAYADLSEPKLDRLRALNKSKATFREMIRAADEDAASHAARMRQSNESLVHSNNKSSGSGNAGVSNYNERIERRKKWDAKSESLKKDAAAILRQFDKPFTSDKGETQSEAAKERLTRWQKALELYVYCPEESGIDLLRLTEKLIEGCSEVRTCRVTSRLSIVFQSFFLTSRVIKRFP